MRIEAGRDDDELGAEFCELRQDQVLERGESLKRRCEELLRQAEARVDKITTDASGQPTGTEPLDVQ